MKFKPGDLVRVIGVKPGAAEYDEGTIRSVSERKGTAYVEWNFADELFNEDTAQLELVPPRGRAIKKGKRR